MFVPGCTTKAGNAPRFRTLHQALSKNAPRKQEMHQAFSEMHQGKRKNATDFSHSIKIVVLSHNSTLILIESGYCYFYQKPQYFWAFQRFKADLGSSRDRPFLRLWGFQPLPARLGFVELFPEFVGFMGRFVEFILGFVGLLGSSLIFREVRWICPGFVDFMGCSLDYRFLPAVQPFFIKSTFYWTFAVL